MFNLSALAVLTFLASNLAMATPAMQTAFVEKYPPTLSSALNSCTTCHMPATNGFINNYALALKDAKYDFDAVAALDSDGDGKPNGEEITALTYPGSHADDAEVFVMPAKPGAVTFNHGAHMMNPNYKIMGNCTSCHGTEANLFGKMFNKTVSSKDAAHATCIGCHKVAAVAAAPTKCMECHKK